MKHTTAPKIIKRERRHARIRARVKGNAMMPRLAIYRSNRAIDAQLIDDELGKTIAAVDSRSSKAKTAGERAKEVGKTIAKLAKEKGIEKAVFDRGGFQYLGSIAVLAEGAREGGLSF